MKNKPADKFYSSVLLKNSKLACITFEIYFLYQEIGEKLGM